ncbi:GPN-loop GTPase 1-like isoform X2 [Manacus candei]|uniref:GPN-loop GTPase 1-like isoform X2 n=1 Tax=Manacus candei TaxID=415023 RepID=UPI002227259D|nr:GPN-loop GTPase 1-like isoform X2 [Manacus candei]
MSRAGFQGGIHLVSVRNHPEALASFFPSVAVDVLDTSRRTNPVAFMSNVLCACSILSKTNLPFLVGMDRPGFGNLAPRKS